MILYDFAKYWFIRVCVRALFFKPKRKVKGTYWPSESRLPMRSSRLSELIDDAESKLSLSEFWSRSGSLQAKSTLKITKTRHSQVKLSCDFHFHLAQIKKISTYFSCLMDLILSMSVFSVSSECAGCGESCSEGLSTICEKYRGSGSLSAEKMKTPLPNHLNFMRKEDSLPPGCMPPCLNQFAIFIYVCP